MLLCDPKESYAQHFPPGSLCFLTLEHTQQGRDPTQLCTLVATLDGGVNEYVGERVDREVDG